MRTIKYRGYTITLFEYQGCDNYRVTTPRGETWRDPSATLATARKWVDAHILEVNATKGTP